MDQPLANRLALVTGASKGIGAATARALAAAGAGVGLRRSALRMTVWYSLWAVEISKVWPIGSESEICEICFKRLKKQAASIA